MPKQLLAGSLDEQCEFLYNLAQEKMAQGNFTGAIYALKEIAKHKPGFRDTDRLLAEAKRRKATQTMLLLFVLGGAALGVAVASRLQLGNDLYALGIAVVGALVGYGVGNIVTSLRAASESSVASQKGPRATRRNR
jgi:hypothetical protein